MWASCLRSRILWSRRRGYPQRSSWAWCRALCSPIFRLPDGISRDMAASTIQALGLSVVAVPFVGMVVCGGDVGNQCHCGNLGGRIRYDVLVQMPALLLLGRATVRQQRTEACYSQGFARTGGVGFRCWRASLSSLYDYPVRNNRPALSDGGPDAVSGLRLSRLFRRSFAPDRRSFSCDKPEVSWIGFHR